MADVINPRVRLSADIGGTFTDIVAELPNGVRVTSKVLTTPTAPEQAVLEGASRLLERNALSLKDVGVFVHGTTLATNAILERRGARTALITTKGFRDVLEIGTEGRFDQYDLQLERRAPLIPRSLRLTVKERIDANGHEILALDRESLAEQISVIKSEGVASVAICFIHAYRNPAHELETRQLLLDALPNLHVSISSEVCPEIREYERVSTTVANAYVQPQMADYLHRMQKRLESESFNGVLYLVTSNGGLTSLETARRFPVRLVESGPAGGAIYAADVARRAGENKVAAFDMGGTTAKICLIDQYEPDTDRIYEVDRAARFQKGSGLPLRIPVIDLFEIGAGGGSIAHINVLKSIQVGPTSAGSEPGPACYGRGGEDPTVTDADTVLGLIDPDAFAGGTVQLDVKAAERALEKVAVPLGFSPEMAAFGVHEMVCENMSNAARVHAIEKGKSIADHTLIAFGGAAPLHVARIAEKVGIRRILVPPNAGVGSAIGFLRAPISYEVVRSRHSLLGTLETLEVSEMLTRMEEEASALVRQGAPHEVLIVRRHAYMRYVGQGHEVAILLPDSNLCELDVHQLSQAFEASYTRLFGRTIPGAEVEILTWSVLVATEPHHAEVIVLPPSTGRSPLPKGHREHFDGVTGKRVSIPVYARRELQCEQQILGPALIAEDQTTTFVSSSFDVSVDRCGNLVMDRKTKVEVIT
ncbi:hydantoinase/oxoprolinase family protein [Allopusillimonas ginsengisoli]|uniref:hydantoinase/oxoprolinase family protein n=1 Tax=Allopusillimonas ginsengisoli TaxID=453575 RepID=UPI0010210C11|nr:hydantoinase/oxoprolinase family protein [Allopusillimonas ginsengisoli]TEA71953.1 hydantoinase/oxoprolinase family protein [Allopusillimonas ginsengisoli]